MVFGFESSVDVYIILCLIVLVFTLSFLAIYFWYKYYKQQIAILKKKVKKVKSFVVRDFDGFSKDLGEYVGTNIDAGRMVIEVSPRGTSNTVVKYYINAPTGNIASYLVEYPNEIMMLITREHSDLTNHTLTSILSKDLLNIGLQRGVALLQTVVEPYQKTIDDLELLIKGYADSVAEAKINAYLKQGEYLERTDYLINKLTEFFSNRALAGVAAVKKEYTLAMDSVKVTDNDITNLMQFFKRDNVLGRWLNPNGSKLHYKPIESVAKSKEPEIVDKKLAEELMKELKKGGNINLSSNDVGSGIGKNIEKKVGLEKDKADNTGGA